MTKILCRPKFMECVYCVLNTNLQESFCFEKQCKHNVPQAVVENNKIRQLYTFCPFNVKNEHNFLKYNYMRKTLIYFLIVLGILFTSCNRSGSFTRFDTITGFDGYDSYEIFQVLHEKEGLASWLGNSNAQDVVYIVSDIPIYNGMRINEEEGRKFKMLGTFSYKTVWGENLVIPVIMLFDTN